MKRRLTTLVVFLLLGAVVSVSVAWGLARFYPATFDHTKSSLSDEARGWAADKGVPDPVISSYNGLGIRWVVVHKPVGTTMLSGGVEEPVYDYAGMEVEAGWPFVAMHERSWIDDEASSLHRRIYRTAVGLQSEATGAGPAVPPLRPLPLYPALPGFLLNTLFYAAIWFGLFVGLGAARRSIRRKRGWCIKCGYDLRGTSGGEVCPECGHELCAGVET